LLRALNELSGADPRDVMPFERLFEKWDTFYARVANPARRLTGIDTGAGKIRTPARMSSG